MEARGEIWRIQCVPTGVSLCVNMWEGARIIYLRLPEPSTMTSGAFQQEEFISHSSGGWKAEVRTPTR